MIVFKTKIYFEYFHRLLVCACKFVNEGEKRSGQVMKINIASDRVES
jgi:hypothetical protein